MISKKIILPIAVISLISASAIFGTSLAHAQNSGGFSGLVDEIASKFNLDKSQVQSVFDQYRQNHVSQLEQNRLDKLVSNGKITPEQKQAILDEISALKTKYNLTDFKNLSPTERKQKITDLQNELKSWAQSQNIDPKYIMPFYGRGLMGRMSMHRDWDK